MTTQGPVLLLTVQAQPLVVKSLRFQHTNLSILNNLTSVPKGAHNNALQTHTFNSLYISFLYTKTTLKYQNTLFL
jgi:hypothetical protein